MEVSDKDSGIDVEELSFQGVGGALESIPKIWKNLRRESKLCVKKFFETKVSCAL